jgi:hypothetical protein
LLLGPGAAAAVAGTSKAARSSHDSGTGVASVLLDNDDTVDVTIVSSTGGGGGGAATFPISLNDGTNIYEAYIEFSRSTSARGGRWRQKASCS